MSNLREILNKAVQQAQAGNLSAAEGLCLQVLQAYPAQADTLFLLGVIYYQNGQSAKAVKLYEQVLSLNPHYPEIYSNLAAAQVTLKQFDQAIINAQKAIALRSNYPEAHQNLGNALRLKGEFSKAVEIYEKAIALNPQAVDSYNGIAISFKELGKLPAAVNYFQKALELDPHNPQINNSLANSLQRMGEFERAIDLYYKVIQLQPTNAEAHNNLGRALKLQGRVEEAIAYYQKAVELEPSNPVYHSNFLLALNYTCKLSPAQIFNHHQQWEQKHALKISRPLVYSNPPQPGKRLRIGYVSPDFHIHSVAYFMLPILQKHHPQIVEIFLYSDVTNPDSLTSQFQQLAHHWRNILGLTDLEVSELIQKDQIDILVDLTGHTGQNRLLVFAHKPAPIQITYLGYPATTGLSSIDYRLTDGYADPLGKTEAYHSEKLFRLNDCFLCYQALSEPPLSEPPCMRNGYLTFGSFNNLAKVTHQVVETWAAILQAVPQAKLMLKYRGLGEVKTQQLWLERFAQYNIKAERLLLTNRIPAHSEHLSAYNQIDIALDPFPYNGTTTTFEALWMGVPVIVLAGSSHVGRVGVSILSNLGLVDWIATSLDGYIQLATQRAQNPEILSKLREEQRQRMKESPLLDSGQFTEKLEAAYRLMWSNYLF